MARPRREVTKDQVLSAIARARSCADAAALLKVGYITFWDKCAEFEIEPPDYKQGRPGKNNRRNLDTGPIIKDDGRNVSCSVDPEERDYYYNLDFLCGTYHGHHNNKAKGEMPWHGLGYGEGE